MPAAWLLPIAQSILQAQQLRRQEEEARRAAIAQISQERASSLGFPAYGLQAAGMNAQLKEKYGGRNYLAGLLPLLMNDEDGK